MKTPTAFLFLIFIPQLLLPPSATAGGLSRATSGSCQTQPQQVHISLAGKGYIRVSWVTTFKMATSVVEYGTQSGKYEEYTIGDNFNYHYYSYTSGKIHYVTIGPLSSNTTYYYRCGGSGAEYSFRTPPATFPVEFVVVGGLGQTEWTKATLSHIGQRCYDVLVSAGGLAYAQSQQPLWDSFGRLIEPHASQRPWMVSAGVHEIEGICTLSNGPQPYKAYNARWLMPYHESGSVSNLYYSFDVAGAHIIMLGSHADHDVSSAQYDWLKADLVSIDRAKTPWVFVVVNTPWYTSNVAYKGEGESMRKAMESLLYAARVDAVFASRVGAYERFARVYDSNPDSCAPVYITLGDAGNKPAFEFDNSVPTISLHRELSFGHGRLRIYDNKKAHWSWYRTDDDIDSDPADEIWLSSLMSSDECLELCTCKKALLASQRRASHVEL